MGSGWAQDGERRERRQGTGWKPETDNRWSRVWLVVKGAGLRRVAWLEKREQGKFPVTTVDRPRDKLEVE